MSCPPPLFPARTLSFSASPASAPLRLLPRFEADAKRGLRFTGAALPSRLRNFSPRPALAAWGGSEGRREEEEEEEGSATSRSFSLASQLLNIEAGVGGGIPPDKSAPSNRLAEALPRNDSTAPVS